MGWRIALLLAFVAAAAVPAVPSASAQAFDLATGEAYGLRIEAEYRLGPQDASGHEAGAWGAGTAAGVGGAPYAMSGRDWVFTAVEPLAAPLQLDPAGKVKVSAWMGGGEGEFGQHDIAWELKAGETVIATGEAKELTFVMEIVELTWEVAPAVTAIDPGMGDVTFRVFSTGNGLGLRINLGETPGWTHLSLPLLAGGAGGDGGSSSTSTSQAATNTSSSATGSASTSTGPTSSSTTTLRDDSTPSVSSSSSSSTTTSVAAGDGDKDSPAPPLAWAILAVLAALFAVRRRIR